MKLYSSDPGDTSSSYARLMRSLTGQMSAEGKVPLGRQAGSLDHNAIKSIFGTPEDFMQSYKNFEDNYFRLLSDSSNRRIGARVRDISLERRSGLINLNYLNYETQTLLKNQFSQTVLRSSDLFSQGGLPGLEFPSANMFSSALLKYDINPTALFGADAHPAAVLLNRIFFNVDPSKAGMDAFNFGKSNILSSQSLERISLMQDFSSVGKKILTLDTETTGVTFDSQVRQLAYEIQEADGTISKAFSQSFINDQMNIANVSKSGVSTKMSSFLAGDNALDMQDGGVKFVNTSKQLFTDMLNVSHVSGHNLVFDINKMSDTLQGLDAFRLDQEAQSLQRQVFERIESQKDYLIDTQETMRSYFTRKASDLIGESGDRASRMVSQLLGPEMLAQIGIGGSTTPMSVENIALNSNLLQLIERDDKDRAADFARKLQAGSHVADTDVAIQASMEKYRSLGELDFRFDIDGKPIGDPLSDFERYARNRILKSQAMVPTRDIASTMHAGQTTRDFMQTDRGMQRATITATSTDLGLDSEGKEGFLKYNTQAKQYEFTRFGSLESSSVDSLTAKGYISQTFQEAFQENEGTASTLRIGSQAVRVTRNIADEKILSYGINFIQESKVQRIEAFERAMASSGITGELADDDTLLRSLAITNQQFNESQTIQSTLSRISNAVSGRSPIAQMRPATDLGSDAMLQYQMNAARVGLPFSSIDTVDRVTSVGLSQITAHIGEAAGMNLTHAKNAKLTSEFGLSYAKMQTNVRIGEITGEGDLRPASRVIVPFQDMFEYGQTADPTTGSIQSQSLRVKAFSDSGLTDNIIDSDLNRFTLSFVEERKLADGTIVKPKVNLVFGANNSLSKEESTSIAEYLLKNSSNFEEVLRSVDNADGALTSSINQITNFSHSLRGLDDESKTRVTAQLADHIKDRGVVAGDFGDETTGLIERLLSRQGIDLTQNDVRMKDLSVRLVHFNSDSGVATLGPLVDELVSEQMGRTSSRAQQETLDALNRQIKVESLLEDSANKRLASRTVLQGQNATRVEQIVSEGSQRMQNAIPTPMTDFYLKNKTKIGYAGIGLAAAGIGYYISKKQRESSLYNESLESQPTEANMGRAMSSQPSAEFRELRSTRRDPLVTAGVVGNLDRNKIGHSQMGPNKYNHLYGG